MKLLFEFIYKPYFNRVKLGEGGLVVFNFLHSYYAHRAMTLVTIETSVSLLAICLLYGFNDYTDRYSDINNAKKNTAFSQSIIQNEKLFLYLNTALTGAVILFSVLFFDSSKIIAITLVFGVNYVYSKKMKALPFADIFIVTIWGGLFVMLSGKFSPHIIGIAGIMTGIAHLFQMMTDKNSDGANNIKTTIVALPGSETLFLSILCIILGAALFSYFGLGWSLTCLLPVLVYCLSQKITLSWHISRLYFSICWIALLSLHYGRL